MFANSMPIQQDSPTICSEPVACSATISFCESGICHRSGCTYLIPIRPRELRKLVGGKAREDLIVANWPDIFRCAATMTAGKIRPSQLLRKLASYPRQNNLAVALREVGRIERTLFIIEWIPDTDMQRRAQIGLNKGEAHHALKNALRIGRQGEIRDRTTEGQHYRIAGLNLLTAVIIYWNTVHLGHAVTERRNEGLDVPPEFLPHISPLGWAHILLTGEYLWPKEPKA